MSKRKGISLCQPFSEKRLQQWLSSAGSCILQPKFNGVRARWSGTRLLSSEGNEMLGLPTLTGNLRRSFHGLPLDGECYIHGLPLQEIRAITGRKKHIHEMEALIEYHCFDIPAPAPQRDRLKALSNCTIFAQTEKIHLAPSFEVTTYEGVVLRLEEIVAKGYEGVVLRHPDFPYSCLSIEEDAKRSLGMMKWKPYQQDSYEVVEALEGAGKYEGTLGALIVKDEEGNQFHCGSFAIDDKERDRLWAISRDGGLRGRKVQLRYFSLSEAGLPPSSVFELILD